MRFFCFLSAVLVVLLLYGSQASAATVQALNVSPSEKWISFDVKSSFASAAETAIYAKVIYANGATPLYVKVNSYGSNCGACEYTKKMSVCTVDSCKKASKVEFIVVTRDGRNVKVNEMVISPQSTGVASATKKPVVVSNVNVSSGSLSYSVDGSPSDVYATDSSGHKYSDDDNDGVIPMISPGESNYNFSYGKDGSKIRFSSSADAMVWRTGQYENGVFTTGTGDEWNGPTTYADMDFVNDDQEIQVDLQDDSLQPYQYERHYFDKRGNYLGSSNSVPAAYPVTLTAKGADGDSYDYEVNQTGTASPTNSELWSDSNQVTEQGDVTGSVPTNPTDPTDPGGSTNCPCCNEVKAMLTTAKAAIDAQGYKLDEVSGVVNQLSSAVEQQGYKLDQVSNAVAAVQSAVDGVSNKLDETNSKLGQIQDSLTPHGNYSIPQKDWNGLAEQNKPDILNQIQPVQDTNIYFSDPGQGESVPAMPAQPPENYPVPIGESFERENPLTAEPSLSRILPGTSAPVGQRDPVGTANPVGQRDPVGSLPTMQRDPVGTLPNMQRDPINGISPVGQRDPVGGKTPVGQRDPVGTLPNMQRDPVGTLPTMQRDPVPTRTDVPKKE
ncbi:hypothetical protein [Brevibacillus sp. SYSU BS000544]|uniref:hypothetical protein n=1 Tax=Brevibacillus sp. SYSU BS000544 TaxID=3416443 RepID=UPI003CE45D3E